MAPSETLTATILAEIQSAVASLLGMLPPIEQPLMEAGLDSLASVELREALETSFGLKLSATVIFDYPSIEALTQYIAKQHSSHITPTPQVLCLAQSLS